MKELELPKNSFTFNDLDYDVPCVFQIWERKDIKRDKIIQKTSTCYFEFSSRKEADIAIRRVGGLAGKVIEDFENYKEPSHYYLKIEKDKLLVIDTFKKTYKELNNKAKNVVGNPSLSKHELITIFEQVFNS